MISITVGIDNEKATAVAIDWVIRRYHGVPAHITLVTAYDLLTDEPFADGEVLDGYARKLRAALPDAVVGVVLSEGSIPRVLEERSRRADVLVVGSHRTRHGRSVLTGRLPLRVARQAGCPVVVVPDDVRLRGGRRVVAGVAASDAAAVIDVAAAEALALRLPLHLLHAWEPPAAPFDLPISPDAVLAEQARRRAVLAEAGDRARAFDVPVQEEFFEGGHRDRLRELSRGAELVVVGSAHDGSFAELLTGSTVARLLGESRAAVCVVPREVGTDARAEARALATSR